VSRPSLANGLPQEIVEVIISHLKFDDPSLLACCLTCHSWYIAAAPHLHHTLITPFIHTRRNKKLWWPDSFREMHKLGLFPLVKKLQVHGRFTSRADKFSPGLFDRHILHQFSSLTNVQELGLNDLDIPAFMPEIRRYFNHFLPTVRSLALLRPRGSHRQILFFIGLFQHLEDLKFAEALPNFVGEPLELVEEPPDDLTLFPSFNPPLRGWLRLDFAPVSILEDMIDLFGGIRFRRMDLYSVRGAQVLLNACAETLEILRFSVHDRHGKGASLEGVQAAYIYMTKN
jgi:hypothetical protein